MNQPLLFDAPWDQRLTILTTLVGAILIGAATSLTWVALARSPSPIARAVLFLSAGISMGVFLLGAGLSPRSYGIEGGRLIIHRWIGSIEIPMAAVRSAEPLDPVQIAGSLRTLGSGGFFGYYGRFRNQVLGDYRMYATRGEGYVLIRADPPYVLTPDSPDRFIEAVRSGRGRGGGGA